MRKCVLHTAGLSIGFGNDGKRPKVLHQDINLQLFPGEITCLLGPNGAGKSTLIRTFAGFLPPLAGNVFILDKNLQSFTPSALATKVSVVLTERVELGNFSVFSVVALGRSPYTGFLGKISPADKQIVENALISTGIIDLRNRHFDELSDGEKQKVMIAKSLAQETPVILLDEPTAFLDFPSKTEILLLLRAAAWEHGKTVLLSTHDLNLALSFADKIWLMAKEKPVIMGTPEDLVLEGSFAGFFDKDNARFDASTGSFSFETSKKGRVVVAGNNQAAHWLRKALIRKGFQVTDFSPDCSSGLKVSVLEGEEKIFQVEKGTDKKMVSGIDDVLKMLENKD